MNIELADNVYLSHCVVEQMFSVIKILFYTFEINHSDLPNIICGFICFTTLYVTGVLCAQVG